MKTRILSIVFLTLALALPAAAFATDGPWLHVEVTEDGGDGAKVKVNVPLSLASMAMEMVPDDVISEGHVRLEDCDLTVHEIRQMWNELRDAGDAEFVTIEEDDETVRVFRKGNKMFVHVDGKHDEQVRVEVPIALVDALLSGPEDELDIKAAMRELEKMTEGEIVRVADGRDLVRVWVE